MHNDPAMMSSPKKQAFTVLIAFALLLNAYSLAAANDTLVKAKPGRLMLYSCGLYAPFGAMGGVMYPNGHGIYLSGRFNAHVFKKAHYHFDQGAVNDRSLNWLYDDEKVYCRWELNAGAVLKLYRKPEKWGIKAYVGAGAMRTRYLYSFSQKGTGTQHKWVEYKELGGTFINTEAGLLFWLNDTFNIQAGVSGLHKKHERMITFGFGAGLL